MFLSFIRYTQLPCFDTNGISKADQFGMLKACIWQGKEFPCSELFRAFPTDQGMCCSFNMKNADEMFQKSKYNQILDMMQSRDKNGSLVKDKFKGKAVTWKANPMAQAGRKKGLQVVLDAHSDKLTGGTVPEDFDGFSAVIDSNSQFPTVNRKTVLLRPGHNNIVAMEATKVTSNEAIRQFRPLKRNCLFPDEMKMNIHKNYSQANCMLECTMNYAIKKVGTYQYI